MKVGCLVPLNQNLEEDASVPKLPVKDGTNIIGRNNIPVLDKRLSRKHLTLTASADGSANLVVVLMQLLNLRIGTTSSRFFVIFLIIFGLLILNNMTTG